ncbi:MAG TPA: MATE family efflux transporter [Alphaproteobacteria bacterium]|nr:MATE family efflux transporter [Alphaproteobacteria bacterium]
MVNPTGARLTSVAQGLLATAIPLSGVYLADLAMEATDTAMVGHLGARAIAAVGLGGAIMLIYSAFTMSMPSCAGTFMAECRGRGDDRGLVRVVQLAWLLAVLLAIPAPLVALLVPAVLRWTGQDPDVAALAGQYALALSTAILPWIAYSVLDFMVTAFDRPGIAFFFSWIGVGLNSLGNYLLIYGKFGFPKLGVVGAGLATGIMSLTILLALAAYVSWHPAFRDARILKRWQGFDPALLRDLLRLYLPRGSAAASDLLFASCLAMLLGRISVDLLAASQLSLSIAQFVYAFISGLGLALGMKIAEHNGAGRTREIGRTYLAGQTIGIGAMTLLLAACVLAARPLVAIFLDPADPQNAVAIGLATTVLALVAFGRIPLAIAGLSYRALLGLKDGGFSSYVFISAQWLISLPVGLALAYGTTLGGLGLIWGDVIGLTAAALFCGLRVRTLLRRLP